MVGIRTSNQGRRAQLRAEGASAAAELLGAGDGIRTRDQELGKLLLYQLSYARSGGSAIVALLAAPPPATPPARMRE